MDAHRVPREDDPVALRVAERVETGRVDLVRFLYADHDGIVRARSASGRRIAERFRGGIEQPVAALARTMLDRTVPVDGMGPVGEVRLIPDPTTYTPLPYAPGAAAMPADLVRIDGEPWEACPRAFLRSAVAELAREGHSIVAAFEPEFTLGRRTPGANGAPDRLVPADDSLAGSTTGFQVAHDYVTALVHDLEAQGLQVEQYSPAAGHGRQELTTRPAHPLRAADNHVLYRETVRAVAMRHDLWASLAPKPIPGQPGNAARLRLSLWTEGRNSFYDADAGPYALTETGRWFVGGLLGHLPALTALTCGSVNGFRRLGPGVYACHGPDNRQAAIRVRSPMGHDPEATAAVEYDPSDSAANPYLSLGAVIHAGLDGIRRRTEPGEPVAVDPATRPGTGRLPATLGEALDALEADTVLGEALGPSRLAAYLAVKHAGIEAFADMSPEQECFEYFTRF
jgi:glutamine synthetase